MVIFLFSLSEKTYIKINEPVVFNYSAKLFPNIKSISLNID